MGVFTIFHNSYSKSKKKKKKKNESKTLKKHISCECNWKFDGRKCNSNQK